jgi:hypothetical protein
MSQQSFFSVKREELHKMYREIIANSDEQYSTAIELAKMNKPGHAIPHLLISCEEMIKAIIIAMDAKGFSFRTVKGMDVFFRQHDIRFFLSYIIFCISIFGDDMLTYLKKVKSEPEILMKFHNIAYRDMKVKWFLMKKYILIAGEIKWFAKAEVFRQNGSYVDMKGKLISPANITEQEFDQTRIRVEKVNRIAKYVIECYTSTDSEMLKQIEMLQNTFIEMKYYDLIENSLSKMKKSRKSFFEVLNKELFDSFDNREERKLNSRFMKLINNQEKRTNAD